MSELIQYETKNKDEPVVYTSYLLYTALQMEEYDTNNDKRYKYLKCDYSGILRNAYEKNFDRIVHTQKYCGKTLKDYINGEFETMNYEELTFDDFTYEFNDNNAYSSNEAINMYILHNSNIGILYEIVNSNPQ